MRALSCAALVFVSMPAHADEWTGADKRLHFAASLVVAGGAYGLSVPFVEKRGVRLLIGAGVGIAAGAGKETLDLFGYGDPSWKDFTWDLLGVTAGLGIAWGIDLLLGGVNDKRPLLAPGGRGFVLQF